MPPVFFVPCCVCCATEYKRFRKFIGKKPIRYLQIAILCIIFASDFQEKHTNQNRELCLSTKS